MCKIECATSLQNGVAAVLRELVGRVDHRRSLWIPICVQLFGCFGNVKALRFGDEIGPGTKEVIQQTLVQVHCAGCLLYLFSSCLAVMMDTRLWMSLLDHCQNHRRIETG